MRQKMLHFASIPLLFCLLGPFLWAQTELEPGFNLFSPEDDVSIGRQSAAEVEKQMPILSEPRVDRYVKALGQRLARETPGPDFPYQFKVVDSEEVNAFALPGGFMYVNRGLIEAADTEGELAGVMAHEISHVALRHGTNQASKAYLASAGLGLLGALLGGGGTSTSQIIEAVGGFGLNATFLKFSRDAERQADLLGAQILSRAGYDPMEMATFFEKLREMQGRDPSGLEKFFSSHPAPADRSEYVERESGVLKVEQTAPVGNLSEIQQILKGMEGASANRGSNADQIGPREPVQVEVERPSSRLTLYRSEGDLYRIRYPADWRPRRDSRTGSVTFAPDPGITEISGEEHVLYGAIVNRFEPDKQNGGSRYRTNGPFEGRSSLEQSTNQLIAGIVGGNSYLEFVTGSERGRRIDGARGLSATLSGVSPVTAREERVELFTTELDDGSILYTLFVAPAEEFDQLDWTFVNMIDTLQIHR